MKNAREEKLYMHTFHEIRGYIISNDLKSGDALPTEQALCQMLGVSRNVLREAIKSMELMGMIEACPGRGTVVKDFNMEFIFENVLFFNVHGNSAAISDMLDMRRRLELSYMSDAFGALHDEDIARVRSALEDEKEERGGYSAHLADDKAFHMAIFEPLGNRALLSMLDAIWNADRRFRDCNEGSFARIVDKHEGIVNALEARDYGQFARAMEAHYA